MIGSRLHHANGSDRLLLDNNLPDIRWHDLRSTFCTLLLKNNFNSKAVSKLMGHAKELITSVNGLQPFIDEVMLEQEAEDKANAEIIDIVIPVEEYFK